MIFYKQPKSTKTKLKYHVTTPRQSQQTEGFPLREKQKTNRSAAFFQGKSVDTGGLPSSETLTMF